MVENTINEGYAEISEKYIVTVQQSLLVSNALSYKTVEPAGRIFQLKILRIQHYRHINLNEDSGKLFNNKS